MVNEKIFAALDMIIYDERMVQQIVSTLSSGGNKAKQLGALAYMIVSKLQASVPKITTNVIMGPGNILEHILDSILELAEDAEIPGIEEDSIMQDAAVEAATLMKEQGRQQPGQQAAQPPQGMSDGGAPAGGLLNV